MVLLSLNIKTLEINDGIIHLANWNTQVNEVKINLKSTITTLFIVGVVLMTIRVPLGEVASQDDINKKIREIAINEIK